MPTLCSLKKSILKLSNPKIRFISKTFFVFKGLRFELGPWPEDDDFCGQLEREERERDARRLHPQSGRITAG